MDVWVAEKLFFFFLSFLLLYSFLYFSFFFLLSFLIFLLWKLLKNSFVRNAFSHYLFFFLPPLFFILMKNKTLLSIGSFPISFSLFLHLHWVGILSAFLQLTTLTVQISFTSFRALQVFLYNFYSESGGVKLCVFQ